jgi:hypothetical protein
MSATQLVTPNVDPVIYQSGHMLTDWYGWCLAYVQTAFGTGWAGSNATEAWTDHIPESAKHLDRAIPSGMYVPIYFSGYHGLGHFGIYKDGYVWCTPIGHKPTADVWDSISTVEQKYGVNYVGWTEILGGMQVVEYVPDAVAEIVLTSPKYQVVETYPDGKQIQLNKDTNLWGMNYDFDTMVKNPVETDHKQGEIWTITNKVHHQNGYDYYRRADQVDGFNVLDCDDYTPPPPAPYIPPAAPEVAPAAQKYTVKATVMYFGNAQDAQFKKNALGTIQPSKEYYLFEIANSVVYLGKDNMHAQYWINTKDNVAPVVVKEPPKSPAKILLPSQVKPGAQDDNKWKGSYVSFHHDRHSDLYEVRQHVTMLDYSGKRNPVALHPGDKLNVPGHFVKDGVMFYRTRSGRDEYFSWYYGVSLYDDNGNIQIVKVVETDPDKIERRISDYVHYWKDDFKDIWDIIIRKKK